MESEEGGDIKIEPGNCRLGIASSKGSTVIEINKIINRDGRKPE
jgi:hypothetical protein